MTRLLMLTFNRVGKGTYWRAMGYAKELVPLGYEVTLVGGGFAAGNRFCRTRSGWSTVGGDT